MSNGFVVYGDVIIKKRLVEIIRNLLKTDIDLSFLLKLKQKELEKLVACIRERVDFPGG